MLVEALTLGLFAAGLPAGQARSQGFFGSRPGKLPPGQSVFRIEGTASVNGASANLQTQVRPGDTVETGRGSEIVFVVGGHSMLLRDNSRVVVESGPGALIIAGFRLVTGKLLQVSRDSRMRITTPTSTIGIRGTGWYAEAEPDLTYFCTCYGVADIAAAGDPESATTVTATHHDRPLYVTGKVEGGARVRNAPFINHTDQELMLIESLVGREPPFVFPKDDYNAPRREY